MEIQTENNQELATIRNRYPLNFPIPPDKLDEKKLLLILERELRNWNVVSSPLPENPSQNRIELFREYFFRSFDQVLEYMSKVAAICNLLPHHPRWENSWTTLKVYLSTWDSNHIITYKDIMLARHMDNLYKESDYTFVNIHSERRLEKEMKKFIANIESLKNQENFNEAFKELRRYSSQPHDIKHKTKLESIIDEYDGFVNDMAQKRLSKEERATKKEYFDKQLSEIIESFKYFKPTIYFSYAWGQENEKIVDELYDCLKEDSGYNLVRDKVDLGYKGMISDFMKTIGKGSFVIVVLSQKYIHSEYCMFELYELYRNSSLEKKELIRKIYPIRIGDLDLNDIDTLKELENYWKDQYSKISESASTFPEKFKKVKSIYNTLGELVELLGDINALNPTILSRDKFSIIKSAIQQRVDNINK